jgi:hypothetical protein
MSWFDNLNSQYQSLLGRDMESGGAEYWSNLDNNTAETDDELQSQFMAGVNRELGGRAPPPASQLASVVASTSPAPAPTAPVSKNLSGDTLSWLNNQFSQYTPNSGSTRYTDPSGQTWTAGTTGTFGSGENNYGESPTLTGWFKDQQNGNNQTGAMQDMYDTQGNYTGSGAVKADNWLDKLMPVLLGGFGAAAGAGLLASGAGAAGAGSSGLAGDVLSKAALDGTTAFGANSVPGAFDLASMGGAGAAASGVGGVNPAFDTLGNITSTGAAPIVGNGAPLPMEAGGYASAIAPAAGSIVGPTASFVPGVSVGTGGASGAGATGTTAAPGGVSPSTAVRAATAVAGAAGGGSSGGGGTGVSDVLRTVLGLGTGINDRNNQNRASDSMLAYLRERQGMNDNMYKPGSPEYNALWDEMSRKDAAAGRNSQYGPRSVDLAARVSQLKMDANTKMTTGIGNMMANAINQRASSNAGLSSALGSALGANGSGSLSSLINWLSRNYNTTGTGNPYDNSSGFGTGSNYGNDDYGNYI